jgi:hypothetical protein
MANKFKAPYKYQKENNIRLKQAVTIIIYN